MIIYAIIPAGGTNSRYVEPNIGTNSSPSKLEAIVGSKSVLQHAVHPFINHPKIIKVIIPCHPSKKNRYQDLLGEPSDKILFTDGGQTRAESVYKAFLKIPKNCTHVLIHDAARPNPSNELIDTIIDSLNHHPVVLPGLEITDTVKKLNQDNSVESTIDRSSLVTVQTPQGFNFTHLMNAYHNTSDITKFTDEASLCEANNINGIIVKGDHTNLKLTVTTDLNLLTTIMTPNENPTKLISNKNS